MHAVPTTLTIQVSVAVTVVAVVSVKSAIRLVLNVLASAMVTSPVVLLTAQISAPIVTDRTTDVKSVEPHGKSVNGWVTWFIIPVAESRDIPVRALNKTAAVAIPVFVHGCVVVLPSLVEVSIISMVFMFPSVEADIGITQQSSGTTENGTVSVHVESEDDVTVTVVDTKPVIDCPALSNTDPLERMVNVVVSAIVKVKALSVVSDVGFTWPTNFPIAFSKVLKQHDGAP